MSGYGASSFLHGFMQGANIADNMKTNNLRRDLMRDEQAQNKERFAQERIGWERQDNEYEEMQKKRRQEKNRAMLEVGQVAVTQKYEQRAAELNAKLKDNAISEADYQREAQEIDRVMNNREGAMFNEIFREIGLRDPEAVRTLLYSMKFPANLEDGEEVDLNNPLADVVFTPDGKMAAEVNTRSGEIRPVTDNRTSNDNDPVTMHGISIEGMIDWGGPEFADSDLIQAARLSGLFSETRNARPQPGQSQQPQRGAPGTAPDAEAAGTDFGDDPELVSGLTKKYGEGASTVIRHSLDMVQTGRSVKNPDGSVSTFMGAVVTDDRINDGKPTLIPTVWDGEVLDQSDPAQYERIIKNVEDSMDAGDEWPAAETIKEALAMEKEIHAALEPHAELARTEQQASGDYGDEYYSAEEAAAMAVAADDAARAARAGAAPATEGDAFYRAGRALRTTAGQTGGFAAAPMFADGDTSPMTTVLAAPFRYIKNATVNATVSLYSGLAGSDAPGSEKLAADITAADENLPAPEIDRPMESINDITKNTSVAPGDLRSEKLKDNPGHMARVMAGVPEIKGDEGVQKGLTNIGFQTSGRMTAPSGKPSVAKIATAISLTKSGIISPEALHSFVQYGTLGGDPNKRDLQFFQHGGLVVAVDENTTETMLVADLNQGDPTAWLEAQSAGIQLQRDRLGLYDASMDSLRTDVLNILRPSLNFNSFVPGAKHAAEQEAEKLVSEHLQAYQGYLNDMSDGQVNITNIAGNPQAQYMLRRAVTAHWNLQRTNNKKIVNWAKDMFGHGIQDQDKYFIAGTYTAIEAGIRANDSDSVYKFHTQVWDSVRGALREFSLADQTAVARDIEVKYQQDRRNGVKSTREDLTSKQIEMALNEWRKQREAQK